MPKMSSTDIQQRFDRYVSSKPDLSGVKQDLQGTGALSPAEFCAPEHQAWLWSPLSWGVGGSDWRATPELIADATVADTLWSLRGKLANVPAKDLWSLLPEQDEQLAARLERLDHDTPLAGRWRVWVRLLPHALHGIRSHQKRVQAVEELLGPRPELGPLAGAAACRARLDEVMGVSSNALEHARRCGFLESLLQGSAKEADTLVLHSAQDQHRWFQNFADWPQLIRDTLAACAQPTPRAELLERLVVDAGHGQAPRTLSAMPRLLLFLGLLQTTPAGLKLSADGQRVLEQKSPTLLTRRILERVYGPALALRALSEKGPLPQRQLVRELTRQSVPTAAVYSVVGRLRDLGLVQEDDQGMALSPLGRSWHDRLPQELPVRVQSVSGPQAQADFPTFTQLRERFGSDPELSRFVFTRRQLRGLHTGWGFHPTKRFVLLSGLSGTGKTRLLRCYAHAVCAHMGLPLEQHLCVLPVRPDWRDPSAIVGFVNTLHAEPRYHRTPALNLLLQADAHPERPYFLVLDEMNLARVERYFADFLSAMEDGSGRLRLHAEGEEVDGVPAELDWPQNLYIGGTVNMDESTHAFSDKVLDRAFTMELWEVDLAAFFQARQERDPELEQLLAHLYGRLRPLRRHFGYRSAGEVLDWVRSAADQDPDAQASELWDAAVFSKILPRLRGADDPALAQVLGELESDFQERGMDGCAAKVRQMSHKLKQTGVMGFWS